MLLAVETKKADIAFVLPTVFASYNKNNAGKMRHAKLGKPIYKMAVGFGIARNQHAFKNMIDNIITQLHVSGELNALTNKHDPSGMFDRL